jgi:hypothetical protein
MQQVSRSAMLAVGLSIDSNRCIALALKRRATKRIVCLWRCCSDCLSCNFTQGRLAWPALVWITLSQFVYFQRPPTLETRYELVNLLHQLLEACAIMMPDTAGAVSWLEMDHGRAASAVRPAASRPLVHRRCEGTHEASDRAPVRGAPRTRTAASCPELDFGLTPPGAESDQCSEKAFHSVCSEWRLQFLIQMATCLVLR